MNKSEALKAARELQLFKAPITDVMFHGYSMEPLLTEADRIILEEVAIKDISIGDIITYRKDDKYPTRRVVKIENNEIKLWCENWPDRRFSTTPDNVLARVVSRKRNGELLSKTDKKWLAQTQKALASYKKEMKKEYKRKNPSQKLYHRILRKLYKYISPAINCFNNKKVEK